MNHATYSNHKATNTTKQTVISQRLWKLNDFKIQWCACLICIIKPAQNYVLKNLSTLSQRRKILNQRLKKYLNVHVSFKVNTLNMSSKWSDTWLNSSCRHKVL